jgi:hypothetical protein
MTAVPEVKKMRTELFLIAAIVGWRVSCSRFCRDNGPLCLPEPPSLRTPTVA